MWCRIATRSSTFIEGHHFVKSQAEAAAAAMKTGMDNECADFFTITKDDSRLQTVSWTP